MLLKQIDDEHSDTDFLIVYIAEIDLDAIAFEWLDTGCWEATVQLQLILLQTSKLMAFRDFQHN